eukprot:13306191-Heterocapsa_arctica.AAC.1
MQGLMGGVGLDGGQMEPRDFVAARMSSAALAARIAQRFALKGQEQQVALAGLSRSRWTGEPGKRDGRSR